MWAERLDREISGIFSVRDDLTEKIVVTLLAHMSKSELDRVLRETTENLIAYDYALRGNALIENRAAGQAWGNDCHRAGPV